MPTREGIKKEVLKRLVENSRLSYRTIASQMNISTTTVSKAVSELETEGVIKRYTAVVNWEKTGCKCIICMYVKLSKTADAELIGNTINNIEMVKHVMHTTGEPPLEAVAVCREDCDAEKVVKEVKGMPGVEGVTYNFVLNML
ncbi:MAG TPA: Lrp/AsnC family transcriptional regulator [Euryarchaeota archaeon]|nr:Lrp/AsnC family transcriptional regulator [Euryarchaeota archaeon]